MTEETVENVGAEPVVAPAEPEVKVDGPVADAAPAEAGEKVDAVPEGKEEAPAAEPEVNPFDFSGEEDEGGEAEAPADGEGEAGGEEYVLDFGAAFGGSDEVRGMITRHAKESGITAEAGSRFISAVCEELRVGAQRAAVDGYKALEAEWKGDFEVKMRGCKQVLRGLVRSGAVSEQDVQALMHPAVFRVVDALRAGTGEVGAVGVKAGATLSNKEAYQRIMNDPKGEQFQILMNPSHPKYRETADYVNRLAGVKVY